MDPFEYSNIFRKHDEIINLEQPQSFFGNISRAYAYKVSCNPVSIGVIADPPTLVLFYNSGDGDGDGHERRKRVMPLRKFTAKSNVELVANEIKLRHGVYLEKVSNALIEKLLRIIQELQKGEIKEEAVLKVNAEFEIDPEEDLNKVSIKDLQKKKEIMDKSFLKNIIKPGDANFIYDKRVEFNSKNKVRSEWDEDEDNEESKTPVEDENDIPDEPKTHAIIENKNPDELKSPIKVENKPEAPLKDENKALTDDDLDKLFDDDEVEEVKDDEELNIAIDVGIPEKKYEDDFDDFW